MDTQTLQIEFSEPRTQETELLQGPLQSDGLKRGIIFKAAGEKRRSLCPETSTRLMQTSRPTQRGRTASAAFEALEKLSASVGILKETLKAAAKRFLRSREAESSRAQKCCRASSRQKTEEAHVDTEREAPPDTGSPGQYNAFFLI